ncbi:MAG: tRNA-(ms[2]io[6]A)-hydroxylase [Pirellulaceae bacterium]|nr:tRNA-(ms[2]io[6]A)-hydroxylase [Pirellulaceae bacterium]
MLSLQTATSDRWFAQVAQRLDLLLIDHAHCEKKAAGVAMNLLFSYVEHDDLTRAMTEIVAEELDHFHQVRALLDRRGIRFFKLSPSGYGAKLHELVTKQEPRRAVDRLLVAALIEARSCERFGLLRDRLADRELADFYASLFESEARHHSTYVRLAKNFLPDDAVHERLAELAAAEGRIIAQGETEARMHS